MNRTGSIIAVALLLILAPALLRTGEAKQLGTAAADATSISGTYTAYLYGCRYPDDIENAVILVPEGSRYLMEIYASQSRYKVRKGLAGPRALADAKAFLQCSVHTVWQTAMRKILDNGHTVGYEIRPLYYPYDLGAADVLLISYTEKQGTVTAYIRLARGIKGRDDGGRHPGLFGR